MDRKSFLVIIFALMALPMQLAYANSSWSDFCADIKLCKDSVVNSITNSMEVPTLPSVECIFPSINSAQVSAWSVPVWGGLSLWLKGFNFRKPVASIKSIYNVSDKGNLDIAKSVLNNKIYGLKLATKNSAKLAVAGYLTGLGFQAIFGDNSKK